MGKEKLALTHSAAGMTVNRKILLLCSTFAVLFLSGILLWNATENRRTQEAAEAGLRDMTKRIDSLVKMNQGTMDALLQRYTLWTDLARSIPKFRPDAGETIFNPLVEDGRVDGVHLFNSKGNPIYSTGRDRATRFAMLGMTEEHITELFAEQAKEAHFFLQDKEGWVEVFGSPVTTSDDVSRRKDPSGYLFVSRRWDPSLMEQLEGLAGTAIQIASKDGDIAEVATAKKATDIPGIYILFGPNQRPVAVLRFDASRQWMSIANARNRAIFVFIVFALALTLLLTAAFYRWVGRPLRKTTQVLLTGDLTQLDSLERSGVEFDQLAGLIAMFFMQRDKLAKSNEELEARVHERTKELREAYEATIEGWSRALEFRDQETEGHCRRVTWMAVRLAQEMGIAGEELLHLRRGALLHDIGKMGIPDSILLKPGKLSPEERKVMEQHTIYAYQMLEPIVFLRSALDIPLYHHEKFDGTGYPYGLKKKQIPLSARIFAVVDVWDALRSDRPYRESWTEERVRDYIVEQAGTHFDPEVVEAFLKIPDSEKLALRSMSLNKGNAAAA